MDWMIIGAVIVGGYLMLSILSGERMTRAQQIEATLAAAAAEKLRQANDVPVAVANDAVLAGSPAAFNRKR